MKTLRSYKGLCVNNLTISVGQQVRGLAKDLAECPQLVTIAVRYLVYGLMPYRPITNAKS